MSYSQARRDGNGRGRTPLEDDSDSDQPTYNNSRNQYQSRGGYGEERRAYNELGQPVAGTAAMGEATYSSRAAPPHSHFHQPPQGYAPPRESISAGTKRASSINNGQKDDFIAGPPYGSIRGNNPPPPSSSSSAPPQQQQPPPPQSRDLTSLQREQHSIASSRNHSPAPSSSNSINRDFNSSSQSAPVGASSSSMGPSASSSTPATTVSANSLGPASRRNSQNLLNRNSVSTPPPPPPPPGQGTMIAGEPLHDLDRAIGLLRSSKFYAEGFLMKKVEVGPDGKSHLGNHSEAQWAKWFVQLSGTIMSTWNAAEMELAARQNRTVPPQYLNLSDAFVHPFNPNPKGPPSPTPFQFVLNSAGLNRILFCAPNESSLMMWVNAIRLAAWERSRCNEIYTGTLLGLKEPLANGGWIGYDQGMSPPGTNPKDHTGRFEGFLKARLPGDTEWRKTWAVLIRSKNDEMKNGDNASVTTKKKERRSSILGGLGAFGKKQPVDLTDIEDLPGEGTFSTLAFYANKPTKKEPPLCIAQHVFYASAIYPESEKLIERSGLFKIEGTFLNPNEGYRSGWGVGGRAERQGYALLMVEEGASAAMLQWIVGLSDAFKLYGRPKSFSFDPRDPSSMYFALPIGPHRDRQFLDRELVDQLDVSESRPRAIRAVFHNILFDRMRGVRSSALPPPPPIQQKSNAPQLSPVTRTPPLQIREEDEEQDGDDMPRRRESILRQQQQQQQQQQETPPQLPPLSSQNDNSPVSFPSRQIQQSSYSQNKGVADPSTANYASFTTTPMDSNRESQQLPPVTTTTNTSDMSRRPSLPPIVTGAPPKSQQSQVPPQNFSRPMLHTQEDENRYDQPRQALDIPNSSDRAGGPPSEVSSVAALPYLRGDTNERLENGSRSSEPEPMAPPPVPAPNMAPLVSPPLAGAMQSMYHNQISQPAATVPPVTQTVPSMERSVEPEPTIAPQHETVAATQERPNLDDQRGLSAETTRPDGSSAHGGSSDIHSDLLAAINFVDRSESPPTVSVAATPSTLYHGSPAEPQTYQVGPPRRASHSFFDSGSPVESFSAPRFAGSRPGEQTEVLKPQTVAEEREEATPPSASVAASTPIESTVSAPSREHTPQPPVAEQRQQAPTPVVPTPASTSAVAPAAAPNTFPSSFAPNKRAEERAAAAQLALQAQQAQQAAMARPGRPMMTASSSTNSNNRKPRAWVDSDEEEDEADEEDDDSDEGRNVAQPNLARPISMAPSQSQASMSRYGSNNDVNRLGVSPDQSRGMSQSPSRGDFQVLREPSPQPMAQPLKPAVSPHGLLHAGIIDKEERSAKALEMAARDTGGPLVSLPSKPPPPQTGLVGAITSHEREKERTGGVGRALTEQQKERKLAEQRQRQLDDLQRQQLAQQQYQMQAQYQQMQMMQGYPGMGAPQFGGPPPPWMMGGYPGYPPMMGGGGSQIGHPMSMASPAAGSPALEPVGAASEHQRASSPPMDAHYQQQHHMFAAQQAAQAAAAAAYQAAMAQFSSPQSQAQSPGLPASMPQSYPSFPAASYGSPASPPMGFGTYNPYAPPPGSMMMPPQMMYNPQQHLQQQMTGGDDQDERTTVHPQERSMSPMQLPRQA